MRERGRRGVVIAVGLVTLVVLGVLCGVWSFVATLNSPPAGMRHGQVFLVVRSGESTQEVAEDLYSRGLIRNVLLFRVWARIKGLDQRLQAGVYALSPGMSVEQIITRLQNGRPDERRLAVIEGWRLEQIGEQIQTLGLPNFDEQDFLRFVHHPEQFPARAAYPLLQNAPSMEGLLFPDTYLVPLNYTTVQIIELLLNRLNEVVQQNTLDTLARQHQLSEYQMVILASIVQREAANAGQMPLIAGIYWKRIFQPSPEIGPLLEADPTVQYARDTDHPPPKVGDYWGPLTDAGGRIDPDSRWNTYNTQHPGWPPTPIASPGLQALKAAASPASTDCYFFLTRPADGSLVCAPTYAAFQEMEQRYLH